MYGLSMKLLVSWLVISQTLHTGRLLEHLKRDVWYENLDENLARARIIYNMLPWIPGTTEVPTEAVWKLIYFIMSPRGHRDKFKDVP